MLGQITSISYQQLMEARQLKQELALTAPSKPKKDALLRLWGQIDLNNLVEFGVRRRAPQPKVEVPRPSALVPKQTKKSDQASKGRPKKVQGQDTATFIEGKLLNQAQLKQPQLKVEERAPLQGQPKHIVEELAPLKRQPQLNVFTQFQNKKVVMEELLIKVAKTQCQKQQARLCKEEANLNQQEQANQQGELRPRKRKEKVLYAESDSEDSSRQRLKRNPRRFRGKVLNKIFYRNSRKPMDEKAEGRVIQHDLRGLPLGSLGDFQIVHVSLLRFGSPDFLTMAELAALRVEELSRKGFIFVWIELEMTNLAYTLLSVWGYEAVDQITWVLLEDGALSEAGRPCPNSLFTSSYRHCLVGHKYSGDSFDYTSKVANNIIFKGKDSLPAEIYEIAEQMLPASLKVQLFVEQAEPRPDWLSLVHRPGNFLRPVLAACQACGLAVHSEPVVTCLDCKRQIICQQCFFEGRTVFKKAHGPGHRVRLLREWQRQGRSLRRCWQCGKEEQLHQCRQCFALFQCGDCLREGARSTLASHVESHQFILIFQ